MNLFGGRGGREEGREGGRFRRGSVCVRGGREGIHVGREGGRDG